MRPFRTLDEEALRACRETKTEVWVDLLDPSDADIDRLGRLLDLHPLAIEDSKSFGQRPKLEHWGANVLFVFFGVVMVDGTPEVTETHVYSGPGVLVTLRHSPSVELHKLQPECTGRDPGWVLYRVLDALTDSFFPALDVIERRFDEIEAEVVRGGALPRDEIFRLLNVAVSSRRLLEQQRDQLVSGSNALMESARDGHDLADHLRDVEDHLERLLQRMVLGHDRLIGILKVADSAAATRLGDQVAKLTVISTIFLPLSVVVGFFGMNFGWLVDNIDSLASFVILAGGGCLVSLIAIFVFVRRTGLLRE